MRPMMSAKLTPLVSTRIRTSPALGSGSGASLTLRTSGGPARVIHICRMTLISLPDVGCSLAKLVLLPDFGGSIPAAPHQNVAPHVWTGSRAAFPTAWHHDRCIAGSRRLAATPKVGRVGPLAAVSPLSL